MPLERSHYKQRTTNARAVMRQSKAWATELSKDVTAGTLWRLQSTWIQESDGLHCAEFTHVSTGNPRVVRLSTNVHSTPDARRAAIRQQLD